MSILDDPIDPKSGWQLDHLRTYLSSNGAEGHIWNGVPCLLLTVHDRSVGRARRNPLIYGRDGDSYIVVASKGGAPDHPLWYRCLTDDPTVRVQVGPDIFDATASTVTGERRERLWDVMTGIWPDYPNYQKKTDRIIPVVALDPIR